MSVEASHSVLKVGDRCEVGGCNARAYVRGLFEAIRPDQREAVVDLCKHHHVERELKFAEQAYHVIDESAVRCGCGRCGA
jgi:hypothetical protein